MTVKNSILKARQEMKKSIQTKTFSPNFGHSIIAMLVSIWNALTMGFFKLYYTIYKKLNYFLPIPFAPRENGPNEARSKQKRNKLRKRSVA